MKHYFLDLLFGLGMGFPVALLTVFSASGGWGRIILWTVLDVAVFAGYTQFPIMKTRFRDGGSGRWRPIVLSFLIMNGGLAFSVALIGAGLIYSFERSSSLFLL